MPRFLFLLAYLAALLAPASSAAQMGASTDIIVGTITGPQGQPLGGATVRVTSIETQISRTVTTNDRGQYVLVFPDGGGQYTVLVRYIGMQPTEFSLARLADEDRLYGDLQMTAAPAMLEAVIVRATPVRPGGVNRPEPGALERALAADMLMRLPIDGSDFNLIASLAPGVVSVDGTDTTAAGFSIAGQRPDLNNITLDGMSFGGAGVPEEAIRVTRVITNTYDVARGQFAGGQVASTTRGGTNRQQGSLSYSMRDPSLQWTEEVDEGGTFGQGFTQHQLSGGLGAPIVRDRLFVFGSFQLRRRTDQIESLLGADARTLLRLGVAPDSVARFLDVLEDVHGIPPSVAAIPDERLSDNVSLLTRIDYHISPNHVASVRGDWRWALQGGTRISARGLPHYGGDNRSLGGGALFTLSSTVRHRFINELKLYAATDERESTPYLLMPTGRVRVHSDLPDATASITSLEFGGNPGLPSVSDNENLEISNELSWLSSSAAHRFKVGALFSTNRFATETSSNRFGTFTFNSLEAFESGRAAVFSRTLMPQDRRGGAVNGALYVGDTWRPRRAVQITYGVRGEATRFIGAPERNPLVEERFGWRNDLFPTEVHLSPRVGFTWTIGGAAPQGAGPGAGARGAMGRGAGGGGGGGGGGRAAAFDVRSIPNPLIIRGGVGEFRGRAPTTLFASALNATGLTNTTSQLYCVGEAVPVPDWHGYLLDPASIPTECAGEPGAPPVFSTSAPNVTVFDPDFGAPRSWRASLGAQRRFFTRYSVSADLTYSRGVSLYGVSDLNLDVTPRFTLDSERGRPVFAEPSAIVPASGAVALAGSRRDPDFGHVFAMRSNLGSHTGQLTIGVGGFTTRAIQLSTSYTLSRSIDQSSFSCCSAQQGFSAPTTHGDPGDREWATSDFERRHSFLATATWPARPWLELTAIGRVSSGSRYTPMVGGDINGDGVRNDRAFIFDPASAPDTAVAHAMTRLLERAPDGVRDCLESQMGSIASRNSCTAPWFPSLDLRANLRPQLPRLDRRLTISVIAVNPLTGLDQLLHGENGLRGWGQRARPDGTLLYVRGFDPVAQRFRYEVNERFGEARGSRTAIRAPFQIAIQGRLAVGPDPRERMQQAMAAAGARVPGMRPAGPGGPGGAAMNPRQLIERAMVNPIAGIIEMRDTLQLTDEQAVRLRIVSDSLQAKYAEVAREVSAAMENMRGESDLPGMFARIRPRLEQVRGDLHAALAAAESILTPEQWQRVPESLRDPLARMQGASGQRPQRQRPSGQGGGGRRP